MRLRDMRPSRRSDDDSHRGHPPVQTVPPGRCGGHGSSWHPRTGWERGVVQRPIPERRPAHQPGADPRHLRLRDPRPDAQGGHEVVDRPSRNPVHPGFRHHRIQRLVDPASAFEDDGENEHCRSISDPQLDIAGLRRDQPRPRPVPLCRPGLAAFVAAGARAINRAAARQGTVSGRSDQGRESEQHLLGAGQHVVDCCGSYSDRRCGCIGAHRVDVTMTPCRAHSATTGSTRRCSTSAGVLAAPGRVLSPADVDQVGALGDRLQGMFDGSAVIVEVPAVRDGVRRHVYDGHDQRR